MHLWGQSAAEVDVTEGPWVPGREVTPIIGGSHFYYQVTLDKKQVGSLGPGPLAYCPRCRNVQSSAYGPNLTHDPFL